MKEALDRDLSEAIANNPAANLPPPDTETPMVSRSLRLPVDLYQRLCTAAEERGIGVTTLMRQLIEAGMADLDDSAMVALADVRRLLGSLAKPHVPT